MKGSALDVFVGLDHVLAVASAAERRRRSDDLVTEIAGRLAIAGEYVTRIHVLPAQHVVDFNWEAHQAGRRIDVRVHVDVKATKAREDGRTLVRVTAQPPPD